jgi:hypothetical protein
MSAFRPKSSDGADPELTECATLSSQELNESMPKCSPLMGNTTPETRSTMTTAKPSAKTKALRSNGTFMH